MLKLSIPSIREMMTTMSAKKDARQRSNRSGCWICNELPRDVLSLVDSAQEANLPNTVLEKWLKNLGYAGTCARLKNHAEEGVQERAV